MRRLLVITVLGLTLVGCGKKEPGESAANEGGNTPKTKPPDVDILMAAGGGNLDALKQHIEAGTDLNQRSADGQKTTPLIAAAAFGKSCRRKIL